jgi:hypothetical protein
MVEAIIGAAVAITLAAAGGAYTLGLANGKKVIKTNGNGNGNGTFKIDTSALMTKELCLERHGNLEKKVDAIAVNTELIPMLVANMDLLKKTQD